MRFKLAELVDPRLLDGDLGGAMKAADKDFDWKRLPFALEATLKHRNCTL